MGLSDGWDRERFFAESQTTTPTGEPYANLCIACDKFHKEVLGAALDKRRSERRGKRLAVIASNG
jgi:hypothetical protein